MKLLILTQKVDRNDPVLGFFHRWIEEFAENYEKVTVICLQKGEYNLPKNVKVLSLGKENQGLTLNRGKGQTLILRSRYVWRFFKFIWRERKNYDAVFVHMNQEYVLLGGKLWLLLGKKVFMWRNHYAGNFLTNMASVFCSKVFCTSKYSYTAKYKKTVLMPVGIDTEIFKPNLSLKRTPNSILFLGRISPSKNVDVFVEALGLFKKRGITFSTSIYGDALPKDAVYYEKLKSRVQELGLKNILKFHAGIPNHKIPEIYNQHEIFVNLSSSGMYDKTIFEATACGCLVLASNNNLRGQIDERLVIKNRSAEEVAENLVMAMSLPEEEKKKLIGEEKILADTNNLQTLSDKLYAAISV